MKFTKHFLAFFLSCFASTVYANNFNYNYVELRSTSSPSMLGGEFSTYILDNFHFIAHADSEFNGDWDLATGAGFNGPVGQFADIFGNILIHQIRNTEYKDTSKLELNIGARVWVTDQVEGWAKTGTLADESVMGVGIRFHSTDQLAFGASIVKNGLVGSQTQLNVRFQF